MQRILVGRWWFYLGLVAFIVVWGIAQFEGWLDEFNTVNGYDPTPLLFLVPLGIVLFSYAVGGPLARRQWVRGELVERWFFLVGVGSYVGGYAVDVLVGWQFDARTGVGSYWYPNILILSVIILGIGAAFGHEPASVVPSPTLGPGGVPLEPVRVVPPPPPVLGTSLTGSAPRRFDRLVVALAVVALALLFVLWTGYEPAVYGTNSAQWTLEYRVCGPGGNSSSLPFFEHRFPLWAQVHVGWSANENGLVYTYGPVPEPLYSGLGVSGNLSFISNSQPVVFVAEPTPTPSCGNFTVQFDATVTV